MRKIDKTFRFHEIFLILHSYQYSRNFRNLPKFYKYDGISEGFGFAQNLDKFNRILTFDKIFTYNKIGKNFKELPTFSNLRKFLKIFVFHKNGTKL